MLNTRRIDAARSLLDDNSPVLPAIYSCAVSKYRFFEYTCSGYGRRSGASERHSEKKGRVR
jgi:hypothetical protein